MNEEVFDIIRKKYVALTPEEKVRQHILSVLIKDKSIPQTLIAVEAQIKVGKLTKRYDILVYDRNLVPWMIIECKREDIKLTPDILNQTIRYNKTINAPYLLITNGVEFYCFKKEENTSTLIKQEDFPVFPTKE
jgi:hypothetical protein